MYKPDNILSAVVQCFVLLMPALSLYSQCPSQQKDYSNLGSKYTSDRGKVTVFGDFTNTNSSEYINDGIVYLFGDITNEGHFGDGFGTEVLKTCDNTISHISGAGSTEFNQMILDNNAGVVVQQDVKIKTKLRFQSGLIHSDRRFMLHRIFFLEDAIYQGTSNSQHINGTISRRGVGPFIYPTGDGKHLSPIKLVGVNSFDMYTASYYSTELDSLQFTAKGIFPPERRDYNVLKVQSREFWTVQGAQSTRVTLFWTLFSKIKELTKNISDLIVVGWDGEKWVNLGRSELQEAFGTGTLSSKSLIPNQFQAFTFGVLDSDGDGIPDSEDPKPLDACFPDPQSPACLNRICVDVETSVWLEGALSSGTVGNYLDKMKSNLLKFGYLPGLRPKTLLGVASAPGHPYDTKPWFYNGDEGKNIDEINHPSTTEKYPANAIDWVLVSLRTRPDKASAACMKAAIVLDDGSLYFPEFFDCCGLLETEYYLVIEHRNHLAVMTPTPIPVVEGKIKYDFRSNPSYTKLLGSGQKNIKPGVFAMFAGNGDQVTAIESPKDINANDVSLWAKDNGKHSAYYFQDYDLSGDVNVHDKALWLLNNGIFTDVDR